MMGELPNSHCAAGTMKKPESSTPRSTFQICLPFMSNAKSPSDPSISTMCVPPVASVELACVDFVCRLTFGTPSCIFVSKSTLPVDVFMQVRSHVCTVSSVTDAMSPYKPSRMLWSPLPDFAVVTHSWLPQIIGLEWPRPVIGVFQRSRVPLGTSHADGVGCPSITPEPRSPRKDGQFWVWRALAPVVNAVIPSRHNSVGRKILRMGNNKADRKMA